MQLREVLAALRTGWWMPVVGAVIGGMIGLVASLVQTPMYTSQTQLFVSTTDADSTSAVYQGSQFSQQRARSYASLLTGEELAERVIDRLGLDATPADVREQISAVALPDTVLLDVTVVDTDPVRAQSIAQAIGQEFPQFVAELESADGPGGSPVRVAVTDRPDASREPSSPQPERNIVLGALLGLLVGAGVTVVRARLDRSLRDPEQAGEVVGAPAIGMVLRDEGLQDERPVQENWSAAAVESFRRLRTNLQFLDVDDPPRVIMVSSALPGEGKTTVAVNLGISLAEAGYRVVIVEADLRRPQVTRYLGMVSGAGLTNILVGTADVEDVLQRKGTGGLSVIAAGPTPPNPGDLLASNQMAALLEKLRAENDFVLVDSPPLLAVSDSPGLAPLTDGVLLLIRYGETHKEQVRQAAVALRRVGARILGVVLNIVPAKAEVASAYGYTYDYTADSDPSRDDRKKRSSR